MQGSPPARAKSRRVDPHSDPGDAGPRTDLPAFNLFQAEATAYAAGHRPPDVPLIALGDLDVTLGALYGSFLEQLPFREETPLLAEITPQLDEQFERLRSLVPRLREAIMDGLPLQPPLDEMRTAVAAIGAALGRLRDEDERRERYAESIYVDELCRVGYLYLRGRLPHDSFQRRFERFVDYHVDLVTGLEMLQPGPREQPVLEAMMRTLEAAIAEQAEGLEMMRQFLGHGNEARLAEALQRIRHAAADLVTVQRAVQEAGERADTVPCLRCGAPNAVGSRVCSRCSAALPRLAPSFETAAGGLDLLDSLNDEGPQLPEHIQRLADAVERVRASGAFDDADLRAEVDAMEARATRVMGRLGRLEAPPPQTPPDQMEMYRLARLGLEEGCQRILEGVELFRSFEASGDGGVMDHGLEAVLEGVERIQEPARVWEQLVRVAGGGAPNA